MTMLTATPLPALGSAWLRWLGLHMQPDAVIVYKKILQAEARAVRDDSQEKVLLARVVGYFLIGLYAWRHILGDRPFTKVIEEVMASPQDDGSGVECDDSVIFAVGRWYRGRVIAACTLCCSSGVI